MIFADSKATIVSGVADCQLATKLWFLPVNQQRIESILFVLDGKKLTAGCDLETKFLSGEYFPE